MSPSLSSRFLRRDDGDWDYYPNATYLQLGKSSYRVSDATRQAMLAANRKMIWRILLIGTLGLMVLIVAVGVIAATLPAYAPIWVEVLVFAMGIVLLPIGAGSIADAMLQFQFNKLLRGAATSPVMHSPEKVMAMARARRASLLHDRPWLTRFVLLLSAMSTGFAGYRDLLGHPFNALLYGLVTGGLLILLVGTFSRTKTS